MDHLVRVEVIGIFPVVSITGYDEEGNALREDVSKPGIAYLDPAETNIDALTQAKLVKRLPPAGVAKKAAAKTKET